MSIIYGAGRYFCMFSILNTAVIYVIIVIVGAAAPCGRPTINIIYPIYYEMAKPRFPVY